MSRRLLLAAVALSVLATGMSAEAQQRGYTGQSRPIGWSSGMKLTAGTSTPTPPAPTGYSTSKGAIFNPDSQIGTADLPSPAALGGVSTTKKMTVSFWQRGSVLNGGPGSMLNVASIRSAPDTGCETGNSATSPKAQGLCLALGDNSGAPSTAQLNFNNTLGNVSTDGIDFIKNNLWASNGWHHVWLTFDTTAATKASSWKFDGVEQAPNPTIPSDLLVALNAAAGFGVGGRTTVHGTAWISDVYVSSESAACTGAGTPFLDCLAANTTSPGIFAKFNSGNVPVDLGATCSDPTGRQPEVCLTGTGLAMATNKGFATGIASRASTNATTSSGVQNAPWGPNPATVPTGQVYMLFMNPSITNPHTGAVGTTITTTASGFTIPTGAFELLIASITDAGALDHSTTCPATGGWTAFGKRFDSHESESSTGCYRVAPAGATGAYDLTFTTAIPAGSFSAWTYMVFMNVASVDVANSNLTTTAASATSVTANSANANEELYTIFTVGDATFRILQPPGTGDVYWRAVAGSQHLVTHEHITASGAALARTAAYVSGTDSSINFTLALVPTP